MITNRRLAHAYLFTGPPGIGKKLFATELAKTLLCADDSNPLEACDKCPSCIQVEADSHPDFYLVHRPEDAHEFPIELMREVCRRFALTSALGRGKLIVIDDADDLNEESANCFLKTLEEPPPQSVIILISTSPDRQLDTIVSRCQVIRFAPLSRELVAEILQKEGVEDRQMVQRLAGMSEGSPGRARELSDPALWEFRRNWIRGLLADRIQSVELAREWSQFVDQAGKESASRRRRASQSLGLLISFFREGLQVALGMEPSAEIPEGEQVALRKFSERVDADQIMTLIERCLESEMQIQRRVQLDLILESLMDALAQGMRRITTDVRG